MEALNGPYHRNSNSYYHQENNHNKTEDNFNLSATNNIYDAKEVFN